MKNIVPDFTIPEDKNIGTDYLKEVETAKKIHSLNEFYEYQKTHLGTVDKNGDGKFSLFWAETDLLTHLWNHSSQEEKINFVHFLSEKGDSSWGFGIYGVLSEEDKQISEIYDSLLVLKNLQEEVHKSFEGLADVGWDEEDEV